MKCYKIAERMEQVNIDDFKNCPFQFVLVLSPEEWNLKKDLFDMGIDLEVDTSQIWNTRAEVNYDSLTGEFYIPDRNSISDKAFRFAFALDEKGIVFIDDNERYFHLVYQRVETLYDIASSLVDFSIQIRDFYQTQMDVKQYHCSSDNHIDYIYAIDTDCRMVRNEFQIYA